MRAQVFPISPHVSFRTKVDPPLLSFDRKICGRSKTYISVYNLNLFLKHRDLNLSIVYFQIKATFNL